MKLPPYIKENVPLAGLTTFKIGGAARCLGSPKNEAEVSETLALAERLSLPVLTLGGGSNLLVADSGVEAMALRLSGEGEFGAMTIEDDDGDAGVWRVGAAVPFPALVAETVRRGRAGLAHCAGIPGRVGGAVAMNAGSAAAGTGSFVREALVYAPERGGWALRVRSAGELAFSYRRSTLPGCVALSFLMHFPDREEPEALARSARESGERKRAKQPVGAPSAGCVFRNPPGASAGALLDAAGCKGMAEGGAVVSDVHANFIVNAGGATCADVLRLAERMRVRVLDACGVRLEKEIVCWGEVPEHF